MKIDVKSNKLTSLLSTLSKAERKRCLKFLQSPYFNRSNDLIVLFSELSKRISNNQNLNKEALWKTVRGATPYNDTRFRKYFSDLLKLLKEFLITEELKKDSFSQKMLYLQSLSTHRSEKLLNSIERNWDTHANTKKTIDDNNFLQRHILERKKYDLFKYGLQPHIRGNMDTISKNIDIYYLSHKLKASIDIQSRQKTKKGSYKIELVNAALSAIENTPEYFKNIHIALPYNMYKMLNENESEEFYTVFKKLLFDNVNNFPTSTLDGLYQVALNYSVRKINSGKNDFNFEYLLIYKHALSRNALMENGKIHPLLFKNVTQTALRCGDNEWAKFYIDTYQKFIPDNHRENIVNLMRAYFHNSTGNPGMALTYLRDVEYENITYNLNAKVLLLNIYYDTNEFDALDSFLDAFSIFLSRHKEINDNYKELFRNLVSITRKMTRIIPGDKKAVEKLRKEVDETKAIASLNWIREKLDELR